MATYTHGHHETVLRSHTWRTAENSCAYLLPHLEATDSVLDVGCGPGTITLDLARRVGSVRGLEATDEAVALARSTGVDCVLGDVHALPFGDDSFDVVHAHQVLQHVADPVRALEEMARVARRLVAVRDSDYRGFTWHPASPGLDRWMDLYQAAATANGGDPQAGRRLLAWAHAAGLTEVTASSSTWCFADPEDRAWWGGMWADRIQRSALALQLLRDGLATQDDLDACSAAWRAFADHPDGWLSVLHGELLARVG